VTAGSGATSEGNVDEAGATTGVEDSTSAPDTDGVKFDAPSGGTVSSGDDGDGSCGCNNTNWSYVWVANSGEGTVSKINTRTLVEEGRYITRPDRAGNPSRTSVSIDGKAVVVANRHVGIVKIWARPEFCVGGNTSTGKADVKPWGTDDCVAWFADFPDKTVQRPVQWSPGVLNPATCEYEHQKVWTTTGALGNGPGKCGESGVWVHRLNGDTGEVENELRIPEAEFACDSSGIAIGYGPYGGAIDAYGNFWFQGSGNQKLVRIDFDSFDYEIFNGGGYGITVDTKGRVWTNFVSRFDYATTTWTSGGGLGGNGGIAQDLGGRMWAAGDSANFNPDGTVFWIDMETMAHGHTVMLPTGGQVKGVSVDIDGYVWAVAEGDSRAYKIDPHTYALEWYEGLNGPYTYSDMTGGQISNVLCNPPEG